MSAVSDGSLLLPVSPINPVDDDKVDDIDHAFEHPEDAGVEIAKGDERIDADKLVRGPCADDDSAIRPQLFPSPKAPSAAEIELHNTTRLPHRNWCPWCVAGRRNNTSHRELGERHGRTEPCLHLDYAFLSDEVGSAPLTVLIGKLEHPKMKLGEQSTTFACPVNEKSVNDKYAFTQLKNYIRLHGVEVWFSRATKRGHWLVQLRRWPTTFERKAPQWSSSKSPVGESQSNGVAERQVQAVEDLIRTTRGALMHRLQCHMVATHPLCQWLVLHAARVMRRYVIGRDGRTASQRLHGRRASNKAVESGEKGVLLYPETNARQIYPPLPPWDVPGHCLALGRSPYWHMEW